MHDTSAISDNKRIAKNAIYMYIRMFFMLAVNLYASRVILDILGIVNFGIYNLVAGVVIFFTFLNSSLTNACRRFLSVAIGKQDEIYAKKIFSSCMIIYATIIVIIIICTESIGSLYLKDLNIPTTKMDSAFLAYHIAIITIVVGIVRAPYNAIIMSYEKMSFYAWSSVVEAILSLIIIFLLPIIPIDKLISYSLLTLGVSVFITTWYFAFCRYNFSCTKLSLIWDKKLLKELSTFSYWNVFESVADMGYKYGSVIILNMFFGVTLNTTFGIANQIQKQIYAFTANLQAAANPQIIKIYANEAMEAFQTLVFRTSKFSFYLMAMIVIPAIFNIRFLLHLWLVDIPPYLIEFSILALIFTLIDSLHGPQWVVMQACGNLKYYSLIVSFLSLLNLPISYLCFYLNAAPFSLMVVQIIISIIILVVRLIFSYKYTGLQMNLYLYEVIWPALFITSIVVGIEYMIANSFLDWTRLCIVTFSSIFFIIILVYFIGLDNHEKKILKVKVIEKLYHKV